MKYFRKENRYCANQYVTRMRESFGEMIAKDCIDNNENDFCFHEHNKIIVKICVKFYHDCWRERYNETHDSEMQKVEVQNEIIKFKEEAINGNIKEFNRHS